MKIAATHPVRGAAIVDGLDRTQNRICPCCRDTLIERRQPGGRGALVVVDESQIISLACVEAAIARQGNIGLRAMDISDRVRGYPRQRLDKALAVGR